MTFKLYHEIIRGPVFSLSPCPTKLGRPAFEHSITNEEALNRSFSIISQIKKEHFNADEVSIMRSLEGSPYIIQFYDLQDVQQNIRLFMEYAQGEL